MHPDNSPPGDEPALRMSRQRRLVLDALRSTTAHPTAEEVYHMVRRDMPSIGLATVYRNLEVLSERGLIRRIDPVTETRRYDGDLSGHYHVRCLRCGRLDDLLMPKAASLQQAAQDRTDYQLENHTLVFNGVCPDCKRQQDAQQ